jgi:hypothetical protein
VKFGILGAAFFRSGHLLAEKDFRERCGKLCGKHTKFTPL